MMSDIADVDNEPSAPKKRGLLLIALPILLLLIGVALGFFGVWSPLAMLEKADEPEQFESQYVFVDVPQIVLTLSDPRSRSLVLAVKIETEPQHVAQILFLQPRILDAFNGFLSDVDPSAFERRGVLDVLRNELATRLIFILGKETFNDILITEFRIQ